MKLKYSFFILMIPVIAFIFGSCKKCIQGNNYLQTETRSLVTFNGVISNGDYNVYVMQDTGSRVVIDGDENILRYISTTLEAHEEGTDLIIEKNTDRCIRTENPIEVYVYTSQLEYAELTGTGFIKCDSFQTNNDMELVLTGTGDIIFSKLYVDDVFATIEGNGVINLDGESSIADLKVVGSGDIDAIQLKAERGYAKVSGSGDISTYVTKSLSAIISGVGKITYSTDYDGALIEYDIPGEGEVIGL